MAVRKLLKSAPVNRVEQLNMVREILNKIIHGRVQPYLIINWYGIPGIGKTTLGLMIEELCEKMSVPFLCTGFHDKYSDDEKILRKLEYTNDYTLILENIINEYKNHIPKEFQNVLLQYRKETDSKLRQERFKHVVDIFLDFLNELTAKGPVVLLFDSTEDADPDLIIWLEEKIISPLLMAGKCLFIWTGRYQQVWNEYGVRQRVILEKLDPLPLEATKQHIESILKNNPMPYETEEEAESEGARIYRLTMGHPLCNEEVVGAIREYKAKGKDAADDDLIYILMEKVIDVFVMKGVEPELSQACRILAAIRQFDVTILQQILSKFVIYFKETKSYLKVIGEFTATSIVEWDSNRKGYALDEIIRHILSQYMRLKEKKQYLDIVETAADIYKAYIEEVTENRSIYILERLFHQATINNIRKEMINDPHKELKEYLEKYYNEKSKFAYNATTQLYEDLKKDTEFENTLGEEGFDRLKEIVNNHRLTLELSTRR
ncbi:MAG: ATP-binding protein [Desulfobacterales bacterium]|nr:ATP-binding protein [Desulfobacterales bacterium]